MKKLGLLLMLTAVFFISTAQAERGNRKSSQAVFSAKRGQMIKVYVDGRIINQYPQERVKVMLRPGKKHVKVKIINRRGRVNGVINKRFHLANGFTNYYTIGQNRYGDLNMVNTAKIERTPHRYGKKKSYDWKRDIRDNKRKDVAICRSRY